MTFATSVTSDRQCFNVPITSDSLYEYDEQFLVRFGNIPNAQAEEGPIPEACITITDDDGQLNKYFAYSIVQLFD